MSDAHALLRQRFQANGQPRRRRLNLRLPADYLAKLRRIRIAAGIDQNSFCCDILLPAIDRVHDELEKRHDEAGWALITRCAERHRG